MGAGTTATVVCCLCCFMFAPFVLQSVGFFTPKWGSNSTCDSIGLVYSCCSGNDSDTCENTEGGDELDVRALGLQATSFVIMFLTVTSLCCGVCCSDEDDDSVGVCVVLGGCCFILFPVAGLCSIIGCIIVATKFSTSDLGYSFALCLTAGCFVVMVTIVGCCLICKSMKEDETIHVEHDSQTSQSADVYPYRRQRSMIHSSPPSPPPRHDTHVSRTPQSGAVYPNSGQYSMAPPRLPLTLGTHVYNSSESGAEYPYSVQRSVAPLYQPPRRDAHVSHTSESGAVYPESGQRSVAPSFQGGYAAQNVTMEQAVAVRDPESGSLMVFMRKINITRIVGHFSHSNS